MTCIVAVKDLKNGVVYMGADSCATTNGIYSGPAKKIREINGPDRWLIASSGHLTFQQQVIESLQVQELARHESCDFLIAIRDFIPKFRDSAKEIGFLTAGKDGPPNMHNNVLIAVRDRIFTVMGDFSVSEKENYFAIGSGKEVALGCLFATEELGPQERVIHALRAAVHFCDGVREPFDILHT